MTTHELAKELLTRPDQRVVVYDTGYEVWKEVIAVEPGTHKARILSAETGKKLI